MPRRARPRLPASGRAASELSREAWALMMQFFRVVKQKSLAEFELTPAQAQLLANLDPESPAPMSDVAESLGCDASNVTGLVDRLEERGLLERRLASDDRRVKMIAVTPTGGRQRAKLLSRWHEPPPSIANLPERDLKELLRILRKAAER